MNSLAETLDGNADCNLKLNSVSPFTDEESKIKREVTD